MSEKSKDIPLEKFEIWLREDGAYYKCRCCGKFARDQKEDGIAKLIYCPECGTKYENK